MKEELLLSLKSDKVLSLADGRDRFAWINWEISFKTLWKGVTGWMNWADFWCICLWDWLLCLFLRPECRCPQQRFYFWYGSMFVCFPGIRRNDGQKIRNFWISRSAFSGFSVENPGRTEIRSIVISDVPPVKRCWGYRKEKERFPYIAPSAIRNLSNTPEGA